jgi:hypothetical protein
LLFAEPLFVGLLIILTKMNTQKPVAALVRYRFITTPARIAHDSKDHYSDWSDWAPSTLKYARAVTDPARNGDLAIWEMQPLYAAPVTTHQHTPSSYDGIGAPHD